MKKKLLLTFALYVLSVLCFAQSIKYDPTDPNKILIDTMGSDFPVGKKEVPVPGAPAIQNTNKRTIFWLEPGDGFFTTDPLAIHTIARKQSYYPLMLATNIYDTTRYPPPTSLVYSNNRSSITNTTLMSFTQNFSAQGVKITPSVFDIVPGDTMVFAITYKTFKEDTISNNPVARTPKTTPQDSTFKLYFFYNNNAVFNPINTIQSLGGIPIDNIRVHFGEAPSFNQNTSLNKQGCSNWVCYNIPNNLEIEKTVFISLVPNAKVDLGKSASVYAVLTDKNNNVIATDKIENMLVAPSHDPNYLVQRPVCLLYGKDKAKKEYPFEYKVHFQNTGLGDAIEAKVIIHLPKGMNWRTFELTQASFANKDYTSVFLRRINELKRKTDDTVIFQFKHNALGSIHKLCGTSSCNNPYTNPLTMGEIAFKIKSTPNTDDILLAYADILFMSEYKSNYALTIGGGYEDTVTTKIAVTRYKECCTCATPSPSQSCCYTILGLCWWWWILILLALMIIWWLVTRRKNKNNQTIDRYTDNQYQ